MSRRPEGGSAMLLAVMLAAAASLLGITMTMLAATERGIAANERYAEQTRAAAESGARLVRAWFDHPASPGLPVPSPPPGAVDRSLRRIDDDDDPATPAIAQDGSGWPRYKQGVDADGDGLDDLFGPPYRGSLLHAFHGIRGGPDLRIQDADGPVARAYLTALSQKLFAGFPDGDAGIEMRITRIEIHGPPTIAVGGARARLGIATARVTARLLRSAGGGEQVLAESRVAAVLDEIPWAAVAGPLLSCGDLEWPGPLSVGWGTVRVAGNVSRLPGHRALAASWPRVPPPGGGGERLWGWDAPVAFVAYRSWLESTREPVEDPWFRLLAGGAIDGLPPGRQPLPFGWDPSLGRPPSSGEWPSHERPSEDGTHSNLFQGLAGIGCEPFDYGLWKSIATSGRADTHFYSWAGGDRFREDGVGPPRSFRTITDDEEGLFFFDTADGQPPADADGDGVADNLTPALRVGGGIWGVRGMVYLNAREFEARLVRGRTVSFRPPGEPWQDGDADGAFDPGEAWLNLRYPTFLGEAPRVDGLDERRDDGTFAGAPVRNARGPDLPGEAVLWGVLFNAGTISSGGDALYHGGLVAGSSVAAPAGAMATPRILYDARLESGWPPPGWRVPRVRISRWVGAR